MPKLDRKIYYWDTSALIAWVEGGKGWPADVVAGLDEIAIDVTNNKAILCTSAIIQTEILQGQLSTEQISKIEALFKRKNVLQVNVDPRIGKKASEIRNYYNFKHCSEGMSR
jgi:predicted nucleic acid-binding protein